MELTKIELRDALIAERKQLTELVEVASENQLQESSLCDGWTNKNVLGHIIGFELSSLDALLLMLGLRELDDINQKQAEKYGNLSKNDYPKLLNRGLKRTLFLLRVMPSGILNKKFIPVPNGHLSMAQLMGDLAMDRAIHFLDIASPLGVSTKVTEPAAMNVAIKFILLCIDLLNPKIPKKFYGQFIKLELTGLCAGTYYWKIGTDEVTQTERDPQQIALVATGTTNDLLFTVSVRPTLLRNELSVIGDEELENIIQNSFNANALWES